MCLQVRRYYHCGHQKALNIQCAAASTLAAMENANNESSSNLPSLSHDHALITQFLLTQCMKQSDQPTEDQKSSRLCETCDKISSVHIPGSDRDFSNAVQIAVGMNNSKPMKWTDENGNVWDVRDETKLSRPPPPPKNGANGNEAVELIRPSEMSLYDPVNFKWTDKEGHELTTLEEKQNLAKGKPGMFTAMKTPGQKRSISSLNSQYQNAMHQSLLASTPEKSPRPRAHPGSAQRNASTGSSLLSAFQSMKSTTPSALSAGTAKRSLAEKWEYCADKAESGMPESPKTVDEARRKYEADRDAAKNAEMTIEEWKKWKYEAEQAAAKHDNITSPPKQTASIKTRAVDRRAAARRAAANDRIYSVGAPKMLSSTVLPPKPTVDKQAATAKEKITAIVLRLANESLTPDGADNEDEIYTKKGRIMSNLHMAALSAMKNNAEESLMSTPKTSIDFQSMTEEESTSSLISSTDESIISTPANGDQNTIIVKKGASSVIGSDNDSIIFSSTATPNQRTIINKKSLSGLLSIVQEEGPDSRPMVASLEAEIAAVKEKLASMPPTVTFSDDEDMEVVAPDFMPKSKKMRMREKAKKARTAAATEVNAKTDKKSLSSILEPTHVKKRLEENTKAYNARAASLAASAQAFKESNQKYPLRQGRAKLAEKAGLDSSSEGEDVAHAQAFAPAPALKIVAPSTGRLGQMAGLKFAVLVGDLFAGEKTLLSPKLKPTFDNQIVAGKKGAFEVVDATQNSGSSGPETVSLAATEGVAEKNLASTQQPVAEGQTVAEKVTEFSKLGTVHEGTSSVPETAKTVVASEATLPSSLEEEEEESCPSNVIDTPEKSMSSGQEVAAVYDAAAATDVSLPSSPWIPEY